MDTNLAAVAAAGLGVLGTLLSPLLAQRSTERTARISAELQRKAKVGDYRETAHRALFDEQRRVYTSLNALARTCRNTFKELAQQCEAVGSVNDTDIRVARDCWLAYQSEYDGSQMILHDRILPMASYVNSLLGQGFRYLREMAADEQPSAARVIEICDSAVIDSINSMRREMRREIGVSEDVSIVARSSADFGDPANS